MTGCTSANAMAAEADLVLAVGTRMQDFTTGSMTVFGDESARIIGLNAARFDATKHLCLPLVADAREGLAELGAALAGYRAPEDWSARAASETAQYHAYIDKIAAPVAVGAPSAGASGDDGGSADPHADLPTYAQVVGAVDRAADASTYVVAAAGGLPAELVNGWRAEGVHSFDCEYGYSCMGYEIAGAWGAKMALPEREVMVLLGDGSYLMMNSDLYSTVLTGHKLIVVVCDNGGYAVIDRLQVNQGGASFNNLFADCRTERLVAVDFAAHAAAMGCETETVQTIGELEAASCAGPGRRPHLRDRPQDPSPPLDRGRLVLGSRRARGQREAPRCWPPAKPWTKAGPPKGSAGEFASGSFDGRGGADHRRIAGPRLCGRRALGRRGRRRNPARGSRSGQGSRRRGVAWPVWTAGQSSWPPILLILTCV